MDGSFQLNIKSELLETIPEVSPDDEDAKRSLRTILNRWTDSEKLFSLDEVVATIFTLVPVCFAVASLYFESWKFQLEFLSAISLIFFWISYRFARVLHSVELRIGLITCFVMFFLFMIFQLLLVDYFASESIIAYVISAIYIFSLNFLIVFDFLKMPGEYIWNFISIEPVKSSLRVRSLDESLRKAVQSGALKMYSVSPLYGGFVNTLVVLVFIPKLDFLRSMPFIILLIIAIVVVAYELRRKSYRTYLERIVYAKREYTQRTTSVSS